MANDIPNIRIFLKNLRDHTLEPYDKMEDGMTGAESANSYLCRKIGRQKVSQDRTSKTWSPPTNPLPSVSTISHMAS